MQLKRYWKALVRFSSLSKLLHYMGRITMAKEEGHWRAFAWQVPSTMSCSTGYLGLQLIYQLQCCIREAKLEYVVICGDVVARAWHGTMYGNLRMQCLCQLQFISLHRTLALISFDRSVC
jgi:hypothetical protein